MKKVNEMTAGKGHTGNYMNKLQIIFPYVFPIS